ncbi:Crp/Fnr family transcriptional regulator [Nitrosomonas sp.]|uniref:Crp/Fnr family transcriptional regulator n=1 Tax=Nitrosomonas sp. TaxID=42353 RepID=UPI001D35BA9F|nr:Crp/Fnr family transcriptional regulator [Nitrosomonas sp.]MBX3617286.1 Crp/Fnr family transcriptional regulator [Nitrosomonas sp.]
METVDLLRSNELFSHLGDAELKMVAELTKIRTVPKNTLLISEGDMSDVMYLIKEGKVDVMVTNEKGEQFVLSTLKQGENFGELSLLDNHPRSASIITLEKSILIALHKEDFLRLIEHNHTIAKGVINYLCQRIRFVTSIAQSMALLDVYGRLCKLLHDLSKRDEGGKGIIESPLTRQAMALRIGCSREHVSRIYNGLLKGGYLIEEEDRVIIDKKLPPAW